MECARFQFTLHAHVCVMYCLPRSLTLMLPYRMRSPYSCVFTHNSHFECAKYECCGRCVYRLRICRVSRMELYCCSCLHRTQCFFVCVWRLYTVRVCSFFLNKNFSCTRVISHWNSFQPSSYGIHHTHTQHSLLHGPTTASAVVTCLVSTYFFKYAQPTSH